MKNQSKCAHSDCEISLLILFYVVCNYLFAVQGAEICANRAYCMYI